MRRIPANEQTQERIFLRAGMSSLRTEQERHNFPLPKRGRIIHMELFIPKRWLSGKVSSFTVRTKIEFFPEDSFQ